MSLLRQPNDVLPGCLLSFKAFLACTIVEHLHLCARQCEGVDTQMPLQQSVCLNFRPQLSNPPCAARRTFSSSARTEAILVSVVPAECERIRDICHTHTWEAMLLLQLMCVSLTMGINLKSDKCVCATKQFSSMNESQ